MCEHVPSFSSGGVLWFTDLSSPDPSYISPILTAATFMLVIEMAENAQNNPNANTMKWAFRLLGVSMVPLTASLPQGVFIYWTTTNIISVAVSQVLKNQGVRRLLNIPLATTARGSKTAATTATAAMSGDAAKNVKLFKTKKEAMGSATPTTKRKKKTATTATSVAAGTKSRKKVEHV